MYSVTSVTVYIWHMTVNKPSSQHKPALCLVDRSPLLKKQILRAPSLWVYMKFSLLLSFFMHSHIFQVFFPPFISKSSLTFLLSLTLLHSCLLAWNIFIFSNPCPFAKTVTFRSFSNLERNCANNSLRQLEPYMVLSLVSGLRPQWDISILFHSLHCL